MIRHFLTSLFLLLGFSANSSAQVFKLTLMSEPSLWDPQLQKNTNSSQLLQQLHRSLYRYDSKTGLQPDIASSCERKKDKLICTISEDAKWQDGSPIVSQHFLNSFLYLLNPKSKAPKADLLFDLKNAKNLYLGRASAKDLGFKSLSSKRFELEFSNPNSEFEYILTSSILSPRKDQSATSALTNFSGPFQLEKKSPQKIQLRPNPHYQRGATTRPSVEFLVIEEETVALKLFQRKQIDFLRRLPTLYIPQYKSKKEFHWIPLARMDYFGFGPDLDHKPELRKDLTRSLNYEELQQIFHSDGRPGCFGLSADLYIKTKDFDGCYAFDSLYISKEKTNPKYSLEKPLVLVYSAAGGDDHKRATDWLQSQWKNNLGISIQPKGVENKLYLEILKTEKPALFRRGINLDRPTCLAAIEVFLDTAENENPVKIKSIDFKKAYEDLALAKDSKQKKILCTEALQILQSQHQLIPTGPMHFAVLANPLWIGWQLNELNQLDLAELKLLR